MNQTQTRVKNLLAVGVFLLPLPSLADRSGQVVCGIPSNEAVAVTAQDPQTGRWGASGPVQSSWMRGLLKRNEALALATVTNNLTTRGTGDSATTYVADSYKLPAYVCDVPWKGSSIPRRLYRLHYPLRASDRDPRQGIP